MKKIDILKEAIEREVRNLLSEGKKKLKIEGITSEQAGVEKDEVGPFWVVTKAGKGSTLDNMITATDAVNFADKAQRGSKLDNIKAIVRSKQKAKSIGERLLRERDARIAEATRKANEVKELKTVIYKKANELKTKTSETRNIVGTLGESKKTK